MARSAQLDYHVALMNQYNSRLFSSNNRVQFRAVMFDETKEHVTIELIETMDSILHYEFLSNLSISVSIRLDLTKSGGDDGKYRICKEKNNIPGDVRLVAMLLFPSLFSLAKFLRLIT